MTSISVAEARQRLSELMARVAFGHQRIVIERRGKPLAALVSVADLERLEDLDAAGQDLPARMRAALQTADEARRSQSEERGGAPLPDSAELIREMREERLRAIDPGLR